jgi:hypothetical protein
MWTAAAACVFVLGGEPPPFHAVAFINDALSHGTLGDGLLSLDEAIRLHNGQLLYTQLSGAEQAQLSLIPGTGSTTDVTWIDIDASNTPVITVQQDLTPVLDTSFGLLIKGFSGRVVLDFTGPGLTAGLVSPSNALALEDLEFLGGPFGVDVVQTDVSGQPGLTLGNVRFAQQTQFGVRVRATTPNGVGRVILDRCEFDNCATAILHDESGTDRTTIWEAHHVRVRGASVAFDGVLGTGGSTRFTFDHVDVEATTSGLRLTRLAGAGRTTLLEGDYVRVRAADCARFACHPVAATWVVLRLWDLAAGPAGAALRLGAPGDAVFGDVADVAATGAVSIGTGAASQPLALVNLRCNGGAVDLATSASQALTMTESRFDACTVATAGSGAIPATGCCFVGGSLAGTATAPLVLSGSYAAAPGPHVQVTAPAPAPHLGRMSITPENVVAGAPVTLQADLPAGLLGVFVVGLTPDAPLLAPPFRVYVDPVNYLFFPGAYTLQQSAVWPIPAGAPFLGADFTVQLVVLAAGAQAPWLQMPPGRRFVVQ